MRSVSLRRPRPSAILKLCGLVRFASRGGATVAQPTIDDLLQALADASVGNLSTRVRVDPDASPEDDLTRLALALNIVLGDLQHRTETLMRSEASHRVLFEKNPLPMWVMDGVTSRFLAVNRAAIEHYGYSREEFLQMTAADIRPAEDKALFKQFLASPFQSTSAGTWRHRKKDGTIIHVEITWQEMTYEGTPARLVLVNDVTARVRAQRELETARLRAADSERLAALGGLVSGVAHEIRTPLTYLQNNVRVIHIILQKGAAEGKSAQELLPRLEEAVKASSEAVDRINDLVRGLRRFTRREPQEHSPTSLSAVAAEAVRLLEATDKSGIRLETALPTVPPVLGAGLQLQQVVINLVKNAIEASRSVGTPVRVAVGTTAEGRDVVLTVADQGPGIPPEIQKNLFEPLVTTKPDGTGLGLTIVKRIVEEHAGTLSYETSPKGTVFTVRFPVVQAEASAAGKGSSGAAP